MAWEYADFQAGRPNRIRGGGAAIAAPPPTGPPGFQPDERQFFPATHGQNTLQLAARSDIARQDGRRSPGLYRGYTKYELSQTMLSA